MEKRIYCITVVGEYYTKKVGGDVATVMTYKEDFFLPSLDSALSVIKGKLLNGKLKQKHDNYDTYRTHSVTNIQLTKGKINRAVLNMAFSEMDLADLDDYCILHRLFCDVFAAASLPAAKALVRQRAQQQAERFNASAESRKAESEENKLRRLNNMNIKQHGVEIPGTAEEAKKSSPRYEKPVDPAPKVTDAVLLPIDPAPKATDDVLLPIDPAPKIMNGGPPPPPVNPEVASDMPSSELSPENNGYKKETGPAADSLVSPAAPGENDLTPLPSFLVDGKDESITSAAEG